MWLSVWQVLVGPHGALGTPEATFDAATLHLGPLPLPLVTELGHLQKDQATLETQLQKLKTQVTYPCGPILAWGTEPQNTP